MLCLVLILGVFFLVFKIVEMNWHHKTGHTHHEEAVDTRTFESHASLEEKMIHARHIRLIEIASVKPRRSIETVTIENTIGESEAVEHYQNKKAG